MYDLWKGLNTLKKVKALGTEIYLIEKYIRAILCCTE